MKLDENRKHTSSRTAGILQPVSSLPSPYGIGALGKSAYQFVDFLRAAGQRFWQVLPIGATGYGDSPYQSFSSFAGNPYFVDLGLLCGDGLLTEAECAAFPWGASPREVDYEKLYASRHKVLFQAYKREKRDLSGFREENADWLEDYALFMAIKGEMGQRPWMQWPEELKRRDPAALSRARRELAEEVGYHIFVQACFSRQWQALREYAGQRGISIIGDLPIYTAMDSADTWTDSGVFLLDEDRNPVEVAGCPPDAFSPDGQLWGNPLYRWDRLAETGYAWWIRRLAYAARFFDITRIDHFRGFESYYAIPGGERTAVRGQWRKGPGLEFFQAVRRELPDIRLIAEDLGFLTPEVIAMRDAAGYPGMKILQFAFDSREESNYLPHHYGKHCVVYTGTHDNDTVKGWLRTAPPEDVRYAKDYLGFEREDEGSRAFIRAAYGSVADLAVIPMQDHLGSGSEARMNTPSTLGNNWRWRMLPDEASPELAGRIRELARLFGR